MSTSQKLKQMGHVYFISENVTGLYLARGVKFVVNFFLASGSIEINAISRGTQSTPDILCILYGLLVPSIFHFSPQLHFCLIFFK